MAMFLSRSAWAKFSGFFLFKKWPFLAQNVFISDFFLVQVRNQRLKIDPCAEFQPD